MIESKSRSGLQCPDHPREEITNFCVSVDCFRPLCPDCVEIHTKSFDKHKIQSWKRCVNKTASAVKSTLDHLRSIFNRQSAVKPPKTIDVIQTENLNQLNSFRDRIHKLVDEVFSRHGQTLVNQIHAEYQGQAFDNTKLKTAIDEAEKLLIKFSSSTTVLHSLIRGLKLDHDSLIEFFESAKIPERRDFQEIFFNENPNMFPIIRTDLQNMFNFTRPRSGTIANLIGNNSPLKNERRQETGHKVGLELAIFPKDYFLGECKTKLLHFFVPKSKELNVFQIDNPNSSEWKLIQFNSQSDLPYHFKSIITPSGDIYVTGGSNGDGKGKRKEIYKFNYSTNTLQFVTNMLCERSSHSICYLNDHIYIIGGFSTVKNQVLRDCEVFSIQNKTCTRITSLNKPAANSCATTFANKYIITFGGQINRELGNSLIEMYNVKTNKWTLPVINVPQGSNIALDMLSFSAAVQINDNEILVFGGYDAENERPMNTCYSLNVLPEKGQVQICNYNTMPLPCAEGFWNNTPIIHKGRVYALQNIGNEEDNSTIVDQRTIIVFNGRSWN